MKIILAIIARNELDNIKVVHPQMAAICTNLGIDYVYIDGNSSDGTIEWFVEHNIPHLQQFYPGRGGAILSAFNLIQADAYIVYSPDGNEDCNDLEKFIDALHSGADLVIASRMMKGAFNEEDKSFFRPRKLANKVFNLLANLFFNKKSYVTDSINGYRAITRKALDTIEVDAIDYTIEYQMTIRAMQHKLNIVEFATCEGQRLYGVTGAPSISTGVAFIKRFLIELAVKFRFN